jgi:hypothetical protein
MREARSENLPIFGDDVKKAAIMTGLVTNYLKSNLVLAKVELDRDRKRTAAKPKPTNTIANRSPPKYFRTCQ